MKTIILTAHAQQLLEKFFAEGKIKLTGYSDHVWEVETFLDRMGYRPMYSHNCNSVCFSTNHRKVYENA